MEGERGGGMGIERKEGGRKGGLLIASQICNVSTTEGRSEPKLTN
jgi:hypothetical protein